LYKITYLAVFEPVSDGYSIYFPDLPGCSSFGDTFEMAVKQAEEALGSHLYHLEKDGEEIPAPSMKPEIDPETEPGCLFCPITTYPDLVRNELDNRRIKTNVTIPAWLKEAAEEKGVNYSRLLETALCDYLGIPSHQ